MRDQHFQRVRDLRQLNGWTQKEMASALTEAGFSIAQNTLSRIELGKSPVDPDMLNVLADLTGTPRSWFDADSDHLVGSLRFRRLKSRVRETDARRIERVFTELYRVYTDLATRARLAPPELPLAREEGSLSGAQIEEYANLARLALGVDDGPVNHVTRICERGRIIVAPITSITGKPLDLVGHFGVSAWRAMWDTPMIGYFLSPSGDHHRLTIAHELGHLVLHTDRPFVTDAQAEKEANRFAAAFLIPHDRALEAFGAGRLTLDRYAHLKAGWGISIQALVVRSHQLGVIDTDRQRSLFIQIGNRGWRRNEPVPVGMEIPLLAGKLLEAAYGNDLDRAAHELRLQVPILAGAAAIEA